MSMLLIMDLAGLLPVCHLHHDIRHDTYANRVVHLLCSTDQQHRGAMNLYMLHHHTHRVITRDLEVIGMLLWVVVM